jgi:hypothetical protein
MKLVVLLVLLPSLVLAETAEQLYQAGQDAYAKGEYAKAAEAWKQSYEASHLPELHYDIAQALRQAGNCQGARDEYQSFLESGTGDEEQRSFARKYEDELVCVVATPIPVPAAPISAPAPRLAPKQITVTSHEHRVLTYGIAAGGSAALVAGIYLGYHASDIGAEVTRACSYTCSWPAYKSKAVDGKRDATIGYALDGIGAAAIAASAALYFIDSHTTVEPAHDGAIVSWRARW